MPLEITRARKRQRRVTQIAFFGAIAFHALLFYVLRVTGMDKVIAAGVVKMVEAIAPPPPPPPPPPEVKADVKAPPKIDMNFDVKTLAQQPSIDAKFDASALSNFAADMDVPDMTMQAMEFSTNDLTNLVSNAQLPVMSLMTNIGFDVGMASTEEKKVSVSGSGKRTSGHTALAVLDIPGNEEANKWSKGELEAIADFVSRNTSLKVRLGARAISFLAPYNSFDNWLVEARKRASTEYRELAALEPEINALEILANAMPYLELKDYEQVKSRVRRLMTDYLRVKFDVRLPAENGGWVDSVKKVTTLKPFEEVYLRRADSSFQELYQKKTPTGREVYGIYLMLRMFEMIQLPVLFCEPRGVLVMPSPENLRMLRTYLNNGGFIYFCNTADFKVARAIVGLITELTEEKLEDPVGEKVLMRLRKEDQDVSGYVFRDPEPLIGHPWIFFPMILPRTTNVTISIVNKMGNSVFVDTIKGIGPGAYLQKNRHYRWYCVDNQGNPVESGYYVYQVKADLFVKTGALRVSLLRKLPNGKHGIFSSYYPISEVPSTQVAKPDQLSYGEAGVFGVSLRGRLAICFTEGYREKDPLAGEDRAAKEAALKWMTNVVIHALSERSLAR